MGSENTEQCRGPATSPAAKHALVIEDFPFIAMSIEGELADMDILRQLPQPKAKPWRLLKGAVPTLSSQM